MPTLRCWPEESLSPESQGEEREAESLTFPDGAKDANNDLSLTFEMVKENIDG